MENNIKYLKKSNISLIINIRRILVMMFLIAFSLAMFSNDLNDDIKKAESLYKKGKYKEAAENYKAILNKGYASPEILYNTGNAYYKMKEYPSAILFYEKAKKLALNDEDIDNNLTIAMLQTKDKFETIPEIFIVTWLKNFSNLLSYDNWAKLFITLLVSFFILLAIYLLAKTNALKKVFFSVSILALTFSIISILLAIYQFNQIKNNHFAIVFQPSVTVKSSPEINSTDLFLLHDGTKVQILDKIENWYKVRISNGSLGWIEEEAIEKI